MQLGYTYVTVLSGASSSVAALLVVNFMRGISKYTNTFQQRRNNEAKKELMKIWKSAYASHIAGGFGHVLASFVGNQEADTRKDYLVDGATFDGITLIDMLFEMGIIFTITTTI